MNVKTINRLDELLAKGLVSGHGNKISTFCAQEAVCMAFGLPITDRPECVDDTVSAFGRKLNDARWPSDKARAKGMRDFLVAQLGSHGTIDSHEFAQRLALRTVREVLPHWLRHDKINGDLIAACENASTIEEGRVAATVVARAAYAANVIAATDSAYSAAYNSAYDAAASTTIYAVPNAYCNDNIYCNNYVTAAADAANAAAGIYIYDDVRAVTLPLSARIASEILRDLGSPGAQFLSQRGGIE